MFASLRIAAFGWAISIGLLFAIATATALSLISTRDSQVIANRWSQFEQASAQKSLLLSQIREFFGYNGLIHHFNHFLLRHERSKVIAVHKDLLHLSIALAAYQELNINDEEEVALITLIDTANQYQMMIAVAESMADSGEYYKDIDDAVRINDTLAIEALQTLNYYLTEQHQTNSFDIKRSIEGFTNFTLLSGILLISILFILATFIVSYAYWGLIKPLKQLALTFGQLDPRASSSIRLPMDDKRANTELGILANAGNAFIDTVQENIIWRQAAEEKLKLTTEKAEQANHAKSLFLSSMSHEIRTPLNGIMGMSQLLNDTKLDESQKHKLSIIQSSGQSLQGIINDVLDMSKIEAGAIELESIPFSLRNALSTTMTPFQSLADEKGIKLQTSSLPENLDVVVGDPVRLRQILWNLLSNAIKFTSKGNVTLSITIQDQSGMVQATDRNFQLLISVKDTGQGIAKDRLDSIFQPFTQEDNTITRKYGGTGLGLTIVSRIVELMAGRIDVQSVAGSGTEFNVLLPFLKATDLQKEELSDRRERVNLTLGQGVTVLVAEDNKINATIAKAFLKKFGCEILWAENGQQAVEMFIKDTPDLIFMDIHMPVMDGIEATATIRKHPEGKDVPIVGLTAEAFRERHAEFKKVGMNQVLTKPYTEDQIHSVLIHYCGKEKNLNNSDHSQTKVDATS